MGSESVLITGANRGIGLGLVTALLAKTNGAPKHVIATTRQTTNPALDELRDRHSNLHVLQLDGAGRGSIGFLHQRQITTNKPIAYPYFVSKTALNMINKCLDVDLSPYGIRSVAIHPGYVATDMNGYTGALTTEQSVSMVLRTENSVADSDYGKLLNYDGAVMPFYFESALITGANRGIGLELVRQLLANTGTDGGPTHVIATTRQATNTALDELRDRHLIARIVFTRTLVPTQTQPPGAGHEVNSKIHAMSNQFETRFWPNAGVVGKGGPHMATQTAGAIPYGPYSSCWPCNQPIASQPITRATQVPDQQDLQSGPHITDIWVEQ
ncbi:unnamed protein product [Medioppia subpectinata]|uniref:Uncharacterized protein n=1 Tax=Medioppia subpectinata TaxID=1979941 RepID=A0A7R9Q1X3_9ACAR|nr:unnamed protein product [Medioppia subpectinata]CAG2108855.1 unnamed protein product [Medioppia subpectinata]